MRKKGQAAMEFLMTYGWAILVVLVVIGALAYFGVLSPKKLLPDKCLFGPGIGTCTDFQADGSAGTLTLILTNGFGETITVQSATADGTYCTEVGAGIVADGEAWSAGDTKEFIFSCGGITSDSVGDKTQEEVTITYTKTGTGGTALTHSITGQVAITVQE